MVQFNNRVSISFTTVIGAPIRIASASFTSVFSLTTGIIKILLRITINKKKKHDKILALAKSKLNNIETFVSQVLTDMEIGHEEFITSLNVKDHIKKSKKPLER